MAPTYTNRPMFENWKTMMDKTIQRCREALAMLDQDGDMCHWTDAHTIALKDAVAFFAAERTDAERTDAESLVEARRLVLEHRRASLSLVQRHMRVSYNTAAKLMQGLEKEGTVSPMNHTGVRAVLRA